MSSVNKIGIIRLAAIIAIVGNALIASSLIIAGWLAHSGSLIGAGIDASTDVLISIITLAVVKIIAKPADAEHPWGHGRAETIATNVLSFIIFFAGAQLVASSISSLINPEQYTVPSTMTIIISVFAVIGKTALAYTQYTLGKRADSPIIIANAKNMTGDILITLGVLVGVVITTLTHSIYADSIIAILIGIWIIKNAVGIFLESNLELMDGNNNKTEYMNVLDAVHSVKGVQNPHKLRMRRIGGFWDIDLDIEVDPNMTVAQAHDITCAVECEIKKRMEHVYDIVIHVEPIGDKTCEAYGLNEQDISKINP